MKSLKLMLLLLAVCWGSTLSAQVWDGSRADAFEGGEGTQNNPYQIQTPAQLAKLAADVNGGNEYEGVYFILTSDLDLGGANQQVWNPIGDSNYRQFKGTFDGNYHRIDHLYADGNGASSSYKSMGLFGFLHKNGAVKRLIVSGDLQASKGYFAGLVGTSDGTIEECISLLHIQGTNAESLGGILGAGYQGSAVRGCIFAGEISGSCTKAGGIAGHNHTGIIDQCVNLGSLTTDYSDYAFIGGIAGMNGGTISNSLNAGSVVGYEFVGGIAGDSRENLKDIVNVGPVWGNQKTGAIIGSGATQGFAAFDCQVTGGLLTGDDFFDKTNKRFKTANLASGKSDNLNFSDPDLWYLQAGYYPQLRCFAESEIELFQQLSALASVPVQTQNNETFTALKSNLTVPATLKYKAGEKKLNWTSLNPEALAFQGTEAAFTAPKEDTMVKFYAELEGTPYRKNVSIQHFSLFNDLQEPAVRMEGQTKIFDIETVQELLWVNAVASGRILIDPNNPNHPSSSSFMDCIVNLKNDLDLAGLKWLPIGGYGPVLRCFRGEFEGNHHKIQHLELNSQIREDNMGFFGVISGKKSGVYNLEFEGGSIDLEVSNYVGALVGSIDSGNISGCKNLSCPVRGGYYVGGLVGNSKGITIAQCGNEAEVESNNQCAGGVLGILGSTDRIPSTCSECYNKGVIFAKDGISGGIAGSASAACVVEYCYNTGNVTGDNDVIGGIAGQLMTDGMVYNSYNVGLVEKPIGYIGQLQVGHIVGQIGMAYFGDDYYNKEIGKVKGGVCGKDEDGVAGLTTAEMKNNAEFVTKLGDTYWTLQQDMNDGYPVLKWEVAPVGIDTPEAETAVAALSLYPNPCSEVAYFQNGDFQKVTVYDAAGTICLQLEGAHLNQLDVTTLNEGFYFVVAVDSANRIYQTKIMKVNL